MELTLVRTDIYRVKEGQSLTDIAEAFGIPPRLLAVRNRLTEPPEAGRILRIPPAGDVYRVRGGETKSLLCGSPARFFEKNGTHCFYPGQTVLL